MTETFETLGLTVLERGWLSSNNIVFSPGPGAPASVVDTGYGSHAVQTSALVAHALRGAPLERILNTHLHSDHCGGNAQLQMRWNCETWVPATSFDLARRWATEQLTFEATGQRCERFEVVAGLQAGQTVRLGTRDWLVVAAPGHDADAVMFLQPDAGVLITADALWETRLAIVFPEFDGQPGFEQARSALDTIERLQPKIVIPGHGRPFTDVAAALRSSRQRLSHFEAHPDKHRHHAAKALTMFHMLEIGACERTGLIEWLVRTPIFDRLQAAQGLRGRTTGSERAVALIDRLLQDGLLRADDSQRLSLA